MNIGLPPWYLRTEQKRPDRIAIQYCARRLPGRNIGASLDVRSQASSVLRFVADRELLKPPFVPVSYCSHLVIARLAGEKFKPLEKKLFIRISAVSSSGRVLTRWSLIETRQLLRSRRRLADRSANGRSHDTLVTRSHSVARRLEQWRQRGPRSVDPSGTRRIAPVGE